MTQLSREAARMKYEYNKKYQARYWEKKAAEQRADSQTKPLEYLEFPEATVSVSRTGRMDEQYIAALETSNKVLNSENRRLVRLLHRYQAMIEQPIRAAQ